MEKGNHNIYLNTRDELTRVCLDDVMYVTSDGNYITIKFKSGRTITLLASLHNFMQLTDGFHDLHFSRIGRSHIINVDFVAQVNNIRKNIILVDEETKERVEIVVSKEAIRQLKNSLCSMPKSSIINFQTTNGNMEAFQVIK